MTTLIGRLIELDADLDAAIADGSELAALHASERIQQFRRRHPRAAIAYDAAIHARLSESGLCADCEAGDCLDA